MLDIPLINSEINFILTWPENWVLTSKVPRDTDPDADPAVAVFNNPKNAIFKITDVKLYAPVVTLSTESHKTLKNRI